MPEFRDEFHRESAASDHAANSSELSLVFGAATARSPDEGACRIAV